jgi:hypothetical protein
MKGILIYDLEEERGEFEIAVKAMEWALSCWDLDMYLRDKVKHGHGFKDADEALEAVRDKVREILADRNLTLEMIQ